MQAGPISSSLGSNTLEMMVLMVMLMVMMLVMVMVMLMVLVMVEKRKFPLHLCPALSPVAYLIHFLSVERPSQCYHLTKEVPAMLQQYNAPKPSALQPSQCYHFTKEVLAHCVHCLALCRCTAFPFPLHWSLQCTVLFNAVP